MRYSPLVFQMAERGRGKTIPFSRGKAEYSLCEKLKAFILRAYISRKAQKGFALKLLFFMPKPVYKLHCTVKYIVIKPVFIEF